MAADVPKEEGTESSGGLAARGGLAVAGRDFSCAATPMQALFFQVWSSRRPEAAVTFSAVCC